MNNIRYDIDVFPPGAHPGKLALYDFNSTSNQRNFCSLVSRTAFLNDAKGEN